jgi:hypothetical protein
VLVIVVNIVLGFSLCAYCNPSVPEIVVQCTSGDRELLADLLDGQLTILVKLLG